MHYFCMKSNSIAQNCYSYPLNQGNAILLFINNLALHSYQGFWVLHPYFSEELSPLHAYLGPTLLFIKKNFLPARLFRSTRLFSKEKNSTLHANSGLHAYFLEKKFPPCTLIQVCTLIFLSGFASLHAY